MAATGTAAAEAINTVRRVGLNGVDMGGDKASPAGVLPVSWPASRTLLFGELYDNSLAEMTQGFHLTLSKVVRLR
ncbi:hypothetical protein GCM10009107_51280 [Ideonella azotifigens]|uniref:Uncharacterized protein n=1 Tax=Ideonella azotifigens TaxID=513160 RepID=A0ABP3VSW5_9BURK